MKMNRKCICEICTCGRHRCPHQPTALHSNATVFKGTTEYVDKYPPYGSVCPAESLRPKQEYQASQGKMEGTTTFRTDYVPHELAQRHAHIQEEYRPKTGQMDLGTTYKRDYNEYKIDRVAPIRPVEKRRTSGRKLNAVPTYKDDYRAWDLQKRQLAKLEQNYQPPTVIFGNPTTFQDDFAPKGLVSTGNFKPPNVARLSQVPFDGVTSHRISFVQHPLEPKFSRPKQVYKPSSQPFDDLTIHNRDYKGQYVEPVKSLKPEPTKVGTDSCFDGTTEFRDRFQPWEVSLPFVHKQVDYVAPDGKIDLNTTTQLDYVPHKISMASPIKPLSQSKKCNAPFQGNTTMKEDYKAWKIPRQEKCKVREEMPKPSGKFDGMTTFQSHYVPYGISPVKSFKPINVARQNMVPFDGGTVYRSEYTPKMMDICPASFPSPLGYVYENTDLHGHKIFRKIPTAEINTSLVANGVHVPKESTVIS